jgi:PAS domain S-box-containing protein
MAGSRARHRRDATIDDSESLILRRLGPGLLIVFFCIATFAVADLVSGRSQPMLRAVQLVQVIVVAVAFVSLRLRRIGHHAGTVALAVIAMICVTTAAAAALSGDAFTMSLLFIVMAMGTATLLPWATSSQIATVTFATLAWIAGAAARGGVTSDVVYSGLAMVVAFVTSVYVCYELERHRLALEKKSRALAEAQHLAKVGSWEWDIVKDEVRWSDELYRIYGLGPQEFRATYEGFLERVHAEDRDSVRAAVEQSFRNGEPFAFDHRIVRPDGRVRALHARGNVICDASGRAMRMFGTGQDITDRKRFEDELARARDMAEKASALKSAFLANMSHEIRTPLNIILGYSELIAAHLQEIGDHSQNHLHEGIVRGGHRLMATIQGILDFSRMEAQAFEIHPTRLALEPLIERHARELAPLAAAKRLSLSVEVEVAQARVVFDEYCLSSALRNLLENAIKFTERGEVKVSLFREADGNLCLRVRDTGIGIDPKFVGRLFEPFSQEDLGHNRRFEGCGLGLALTRRYLEMNGASISVESQQRLGSTFTIRFSGSAAADSSVLQQPPSRRGDPNDSRRLEPTSITASEKALRSA